MRNIREVWEKFRDPLNLLKSRKAEIDTEISRLQGRLERLPVLQAEIAERKNTLNSTQGILGKSLKELDSVQTTRTKLERRANEVLKAERELAQAQRTLQGAGAPSGGATTRADAETAQKLVAEHQAGYSAYLEAQTAKKNWSCLYANGNKWRRNAPMPTSEWRYMKLRR